LQAEFQQRHGVRIGAEHPLAMARLWWAAEIAKKQLSFQPYAQIREEALMTQHGKPLHLELELPRAEYEKMILPLVESTLDSVSKALEDAGRKASELDAILLVGGSTRTPLVSRLLRERIGLEPREDVHPDLCVALGAGVLASRLAGREVERVLVDVSPYSFGPSYLGERGGVSYPYCYHPIIRRNTPLPVTRTDSYYTTFPGQREVEIQIFQGDNEDALQNVLVGDFRVEGLSTADEPNEVMCRMSLDIDGILHVAAIEKRTGKSKHITIANAMQAKNDAEIAAARKRIADLYSSREAFLEDEDVEEVEADDEEADVEIAEPAWENGSVVEVQKTNGKVIPMDSNWVEHRREAVDLIQRSRRLLDSMHADDKEEAIVLTAAIETAVAHRDSHALTQALKSLKELLFFVEGI
jgi:molecular chaperone DnaK (HSP70)